MSAKDFDKAIVLHETDSHTIALLGKKEDPGPSGIGLFQNHGSVRPGQPMFGDTVFTKQDDGTFDVTHLPKTSESKVGPAQVATSAYRANYDRIFRKHDLN